MSVSITYSQTGVPAAVTITPGPGVDIVGALAGRGYVSSAVGVDGHLRLLATDGTVEDLGPVTAVIGRVIAAGSGQGDGTPVLDGITIIGPGGPIGGGLTLTAPGRWEVINRSGSSRLVYPPPGGNFDGLALNAPVQVLDGTVAFFTCPPLGQLWTVS